MIKYIIEKLAPILQIFILPIGKVEWRAKKEISDKDKEEIKKLLKSDYYIILTRRTNHLSSYFTSFIELVNRGKLGFWAHAIMNLEDTVTDEKDFRLMEATGTGVHYSEFSEVFNVQAVALMKPKSMSLAEWTDVLDDARAQLGKPYDTLFDIYDSSKLSCIELVRKILMGQPNYERDFPNFEKMIKEVGNLSPQMLYDCEDFEVVLEIKV